MKEIRVGSWDELVSRLFGEAWQPEIGRHRSNFVFRGVSDASLPLLTSLQAGAFERHEKHLLTSFRKYAQENALAHGTEWNWMSLAKHHGLPTRLLDWSYSPLVALHFATHDPLLFDRDAVVWCADYRATNTLLPKKFLRALEEAGVNIVSTEMLETLTPTLESLERLASRDFVVFFEPPSLDQRIVNQFALFSLPSRAGLHLGALLDAQGEAHRRIVIPAELKWEIRDKLDQGNITERVLFPGLDGLCRWLSRYFMTRPPA